MFLWPASRKRILLLLSLTIVVYFFVIGGGIVFSGDVSSFSTFGVEFPTPADSKEWIYRLAKQYKDLNYQHEENATETDYGSRTTTPTVSFLRLRNDVLIRHFQGSLSFTENWPRTCTNDRGSNISLVIIVTSSVGNFDARDAIRQTWGGYAREKGAKLLFLLGQTFDEKLRQEVLGENILSKDIIQGNFIDNYKNMTLKTVCLMKWVVEFCNKAKFVLKTDDDMFVNIDLLFKYLNAHSDMRKSIVGKVAKKWAPHRNLMNKWYVSKKVFPDKYFPHFTTGPAYLVSGDAVSLLYEASLDFPFFQLEDVFMTGFVARNVSIKLVNNPQMKNKPVKVNKCNFGEIMTSHKYKPGMLEDTWIEVHRKNVTCKKKRDKKIKWQSRKPLQT